MIDCACGKIHENNWEKDLFEVDGEMIRVWALCEKHAVHAPCRQCFLEESVVKLGGKFND